MTEFISRKYGNEGYEIIIKTDSHEHYKATEDFARRLIGHTKPVADNNVGGKWIPVTERLPEKNGRYLCRYLFHDYQEMPFEQVISFFATDETPHFANEGDELGMKVTHWMPLPEPPKEE